MPQNFFSSIFFTFFFVDLLEEHLSFRTHLDSWKNIKNSLLCDIFKIFCHLWLGPKTGISRQNVDFLGFFDTKTAKNAQTLTRPRPFATYRMNTLIGSFESPNYALSKQGGPNIVVFHAESTDSLVLPPQWRFRPFLAVLVQNRPKSSL